LIQDLENAWAKAPHPQEAYFPDAGATDTLKVRADRLAVPRVAGTVDPLDWLREPYRSQYEDFGARLKSDVLPDDVPRPCFMVDQDHEATVRDLLLTSKMAVLLDEAEVARYGGDRLLLNGLFCVKHKLDFDRLIIDRRPANAGEVPLDWTALPYGPQLGRLQLPRGHVLRGSGDDLKTWFYQLKCLEAALSRN